MAAAALVASSVDIALAVANICAITLMRQRRRGQNPRWFYCPGRIAIPLIPVGLYHIGELRLDAFGASVIGAQTVAWTQTNIGKMKRHICPESMRFVRWILWLSLR